MYLFFAVLMLSCVYAQGQTITNTFGEFGSQFSIDFVKIGDPFGNPPPPFESVPYAYHIGKHEVSRDMITKANSAGSLGITLQDMTSFGGNGVNRPATGISWYEAAKFVNWLNTSKGYQAAYSFDGSGNFQLWGTGQYNGGNQFRHKDAYYFLPSVDEWYKAAYGKPDGSWSNYPNGSNSAPTAVAGGAADNTWVAAQGFNSGPADITHAGGLSGYGTMAQGGNVWEWSETAFDGENNSASERRQLRGGYWDSFLLHLDASFRTDTAPTEESISSGFRVASVPEPSSLSLLLAGGAVIAAAKRRRLV